MTSGSYLILRQGKLPKPVNLKPECIIKSINEWNGWKKVLHWTRKSV